MKNHKQVFLFCLLITLLLYSSDGEFLREIGGTGKGPGEFLYTILNSASFLEWQESSKIMLPVALSDIKIDSNPVIVKVTLKN